MKKDHLTRSFPLLVLSVLLAVGLSKCIYWTFGSVWDVKVFSPLSDIQETPSKNIPSKPQANPSSPKTEQIASEKPGGKKPASVQEPTAEEPEEEEPISDEPEEAPIPSGLSDFSKGRKWSNNIIKGLRKANSQAMYVAFLGDSFIEGDIVVESLRNFLQKEYGGMGVGFVPMTSQTNRFRQTVHHEFGKGWKKQTAAHKRTEKYMMSEMVFRAADPTWARFQTSKRYASLRAVERVGLVYAGESNTRVHYRLNGGDAVSVELENTSSGANIFYPEVTDQEGLESFRLDVVPEEAANAVFYGVVMDAKKGVSVDNFSSRGYSGATIAGLDTEVCRALNRIRPYKLIILSYGLNVVDPDHPQRSYGSYIRQMKHSVEHLKEIYPDVPILIMSVSQRMQRRDGELKILPGVTALLRGQYRLAKEMHCLFWNTYEAMESLGGIGALVKKGWAAKDYTHIGFKAGEKLAALLFDDLCHPLKDRVNASSAEQEPTEAEAEKGVSEE